MNICSAMIQEFFNPSSGILESTWEGPTDLQEIIDYIRRTKVNPDYPRKLKILTFAEKALLTVSLDDLNLIAQENKQSVENYIYIVDAFIVDEAIVAALSTMYKKVSAVKNYQFNIFSSREAARNWLDSI